MEYPDDLLAGIDEKRLGELAHEALFVRLNEQGLLSSGRAAQLLGLSPMDFLDLLGRYRVSYFDESADLAAEVRRARS
jgi:predicted HTH domain antitoxin